MTDARTQWLNDRAKWLSRELNNTGDISRAEHHSSDSHPMSRSIGNMKLQPAKIRRMIFREEWQREPSELTKTNQITV